jgi:hypothetical protein
MTKLGNAVAKVLGEIFESKPKWSEWKSVLRFVIPFFGWLLEWLLFFRWNFRRLLWVMGFAVILFGIWALKPIPQKEKEDVPAELPAAITPTVVAMDSPDDEEETVYQQPDSHKEAVRLPGPDEWYVDAPAGRYGKEVILANGYHYDFYPEDNVNGLPDPNNPNSNSVPFQDGPGIKSPTRYFHSVAWTSRTGFDTRVKVVRTWKGTTAII